MKLNNLLFYLIIFFSINFSFCQNFTNDRDKFVKEWMKFATTES